jgi:tRNA(Met) cytidine acetyltransferase
LLAKQWRISRIAIAPEHHRKGLGTQLLDFLEEQAKQQQVKFLTASFGCNTDTLSFWFNSKFLLAKLSSKPEISSGEHSAICIKSLTNESLIMSDSINRKFYQEWLYQMDKDFQQLPEALLIKIILLKPNTNIDGTKDMEILKQFALGKRSYSTCKRLLKEYLLDNSTCFSKVDTQHKALLVAALLQNLTDKKLCEKFTLSGKKQIEQTLKASFRTVFIDPQSIVS